MSASGGALITFEGIDGAGKSMAIAAIAAWLVSLGVDHIVTKEPGGGMMGRSIRTLLLDPENHWTPTAELFLYLADRAQHGADVIRPGVIDGKVVLCDRYVDSTMAYQGFGRHMDKRMLRAMNKVATKNCDPELVVVLDIPPEISRERLSRGGRPDRIEREGVDFFRRVRDGYLAIAAEGGKRYVVIDANQSPAAVLEEVKAAVTACLVAKGLIEPDPTAGGALPR